MSLLDRFKGKKQNATGTVPPLEAVVCDQAVGWAHEVVDHLRLLHPQALTDLEVKATIEKGVGRVHSVNVPGISQAPMPACLYVDFPLRHAFLGRDVARMVQALGVDPGEFSSFNLTVRDADVSLMGVALPIEEERLKYGKAFMQHLLEIEEGLRERQDALHETMSAFGQAGISWDRDAGVLVFKPNYQPEIRVQADVLGSYAPNLQSWCWAWANSSFEESQVQAVSALRQKPLAILKTGGFDCSESFAFTAAHCAAAFLGNKPVWRWPLASGPQLFFAMAP